MDIDALSQEAYKKIIINNYREAVKLLNKAISCDPNDWRLYSNRCYCHLELNDIAKAKADAIALKEHFGQENIGALLLGEVFLRKKKYEEAEEQFRLAYVHLPAQEIQDRLFEAQMQQILLHKHDRTLAKKALIHTRTVKDALACLAQGEVPQDTWVKGPELTFTPEERKHLINELKKVGVTFPASMSQTPQPIQINKELKDPLRDPANPLKAETIWVGNLNPTVTEDKLIKLFQAVGRVHSIIIKINPNTKLCHAFVNFLNAKTAGKAMEKFQNYPFDQDFLILRYPNRMLQGRH